MINCTIDGKKISLSDKKTILEAALANGIEIPHFCYHKNIGIEGSCRICLVEIKGSPKLLPSCVTPVSEGMEINTKSESVVKARKGVLEFLLANHPLDCPICDKGGECPLQDYSYTYGAGNSRFKEEKARGTKHQILGEHIVYDSERCILCTRCVRFMSEVTSEYELGRIKRGDRTVISLASESSLKSNFSANLADICPVGALTLREFRFKARPWELTKFDTLCTECSIGCEIRVSLLRDKVLRITPRQKWLCDDGRFKSTRDELPHYPMARKQEANEMEQTDIINVRNGISNILTQYSRSEIALFLSDDMYNEEISYLLKIFDGCRISLPLEKQKFLLLKSLKSAQSNMDNKSSFIPQRFLILGEDPSTVHPILHLYLNERSTNNQKSLVICEDDIKIPYSRYDFIKSDLNNFKKELTNYRSSEKYRLISGYINDKDTTILISYSWLNSELVNILTSFDGFSNFKCRILSSGLNLNGLVNLLNEQKLSWDFDGVKVVLYPSLKSELIKEVHGLDVDKVEKRIIIDQNGTIEIADLFLPIGKTKARKGSFYDLFDCRREVPSPIYKSEFGIFDYFIYERDC